VPGADRPARLTHAEQKTASSARHRTDAARAARAYGRGMDTHAHRVVIAGGGVAGLEALIALQAFAGDRLDVTLLEPSRRFVLQARSVEQPFAGAGARQYRLDLLCEDHGARHERASLAAVEWDQVRTSRGGELPFDSLIVAIGARRVEAFREALTFRDLRDADRMHQVVAALEGGRLDRLAFVVPPGTTWPLPLYELALLAAQRATDLGRHDLALTLVTPEPSPLAAFGPEIGVVVAEALAEAGIRAITGVDVHDVRDGVVFARGGAEVVSAQRVVALPRLVGPRVPGMHSDAQGFLLTNGFARADGLRGVYAVGDGSDQPVKQGGVGAQQALTAASHVAMRAGADVRPIAFEPALRAKLLTGSGAWYLRRTAPDGGATVSSRALWWPPAKVVAPHLAAYLEALDEGRRGPAPPPVTSAVLGRGDPAGGVELLGS
jgi:sulfide:quinone oxidoreductase